MIPTFVAALKGLAIRPPAASVRVIPSPAAGPSQVSRTRRGPYYSRPGREGHGHRKQSPPAARQTRTQRQAGRQRGSSGDLRAAKLAFDLEARERAAAAGEQAAAPEELTETDQQILERVYARMRLVFLEEYDGPD